MNRFVKIVLHGSLIVFLTLLTQIGGLAWMVALFSRWRTLTFFAVYICLSVSAIWLAPSISGRVALSCFADETLKVQSWLYCGLNRNYVSRELKAVLDDLAAETSEAFPETQTLVLDGSFPFLDGFPLLPHLSHDDGDKADLALYYMDGSGYLPGATRSPIGYFAFEQGPTDCPQNILTLRWDFELLQPWWRDLKLEPARSRFVLNWLASNARVGKIFLEPHLKSRLGTTGSKIRFQGCRAARHDDHIHFQL
ncbi:hypothetical protein [Roseibium salinum]|uniref:Uncharacterized protein n=1 Tax=Roseibium salinum TaxID=1604349 RepID=A0ABT3R7E9_9HYPH|nr:hypothetical protein [Roseibium sp. DSM 29163]MCX2725056.1 hypothetical protein [Roseibium sp. DSM 29163]